MKRLPGAIDVEKFAEVFGSELIHGEHRMTISEQARAFEMDAMQTAMKTAQ